MVLLFTRQMKEFSDMLWLKSRTIELPYNLSKFFFRQTCKVASAQIYT